jgi:hypothetical protein
MWDGAGMTTKTQLLNGVDFIAFPTKDWGGRQEVLRRDPRVAFREAMG